MNARLLLILAVTAALVLPACSSGSSPTGVLEQNIDAQGEALEALRQRVSDVVDRLDAVEGRTTGGSLAALADQVEQLTADLDQVRTDLVTSGEDVTASVEADIGQLEEQVAEAVAELQALSRRLSTLADRVDGLERRIENLESRSGGSGDNG